MLFSSYVHYETYDNLLLIIGALFIAGVGLMSITFFLDEYWGDQEYREYLKDGKRRKAKG